MTAILVSNCDNWEGLYIDGELVEEGHRVDLKNHLKAIGGELTTQDVSVEYTDEFGCLPDNYDEIPKEMFL